MIHGYFLKLFKKIMITQLFYLFLNKSNQQINRCFFFSICFIEKKKIFSTERLLTEDRHQ